MRLKNPNCAVFEDGGGGPGFAVAGRRDCGGGCRSARRLLAAFFAAAGAEGARRNGAGHILAEDHLRIFAVEHRGMVGDEARHLGHGAAVALLRPLGQHQRLGLAEGGHRLQPRAADALGGQIRDHGLGTAHPERLVVGVRADKIGMAIDAEAQFGKLADEIGLLAQGRL